MEQTTNSFIKGLRMDYNPMSTPNETLTDALNASVITMNDNEVSLQNDMGNRKLDGVELPEGYTPVGIKEYGGVVYIASYNPLTGKGLVGSFPSPKQGNFIDHTTKTQIDYTSFSTIESQYGWKELISTSYIKLLSTENIHPGDKFQFIVEGEDDNFEIEYGVLNNLNEFIPIDIDISTYQNLTYTGDTSNRTYSIAQNIDRNQADLNTYTGNIVGPLAAKISLSTILEYNPNVHVYWDNGTIKVSITSDQDVPDGTRFYYWADLSDHKSDIEITNTPISLTLSSGAQILHCAILTQLDDDIYVNRFQNNYSVDLIQQSSYEIIGWNYSYTNGTAHIHFELADYSTDPSKDGIIVIYSDGQENIQITFPYNQNQTYSAKIVLKANLFIPMELKTQNGQRIGTRWILTTELFNNINKVKDLGNPTEADKSLIETLTNSSEEDPFQLDLGDNPKYSGNYITNKDQTEYTCEYNCDISLIPDNIIPSNFPELEYDSLNYTINSNANYTGITREVSIDNQTLTYKLTYKNDTDESADIVVGNLFKPLDKIISEKTNSQVEEGPRLFQYQDSDTKNIVTLLYSTYSQSELLQNIVSVKLCTSSAIDVDIKVGNEEEYTPISLSNTSLYRKFNTYNNISFGNNLFLFIINNFNASAGNPEYPIQLEFPNDNKKFDGTKYGRLFGKLNNNNTNTFGLFPNILVYDGSSNYVFTTVNKENFPYCFCGLQKTIQAKKIKTDDTLPLEFLDTLNLNLVYKKTLNLDCYVPTFTFVKKITNSLNFDRTGDENELIEKILITPQGDIESCLEFNIDTDYNLASLYDINKNPLPVKIKFANNGQLEYFVTDELTNNILTADVLYHKSGNDFKELEDFYGGKILPTFEDKNITYLYEMDYSDYNLIIT